PLRVVVFLPVATSHTFISLMHLPPEASVLPSWLNTTMGAAYCLMSSKRVVALRVPTSHSLILLAKRPEASVLPSGLNATELAQKSATFSLASSLTVATSQNRIVFSSPPQARVLPSGLKATHESTSLRPSKVNRSLGSWADRRDEKSRHHKVMPR